MPNFAPSSAAIFIVYIYFIVRLSSSICGRLARLQRWATRKEASGTGTRGTAGACQVPLVTVATECIFLRFFWRNWKAAYS